MLLCTIKLNWFFMNKYLAEDDSIERLVEGDLNLHVLLAAHDLQVSDVGHLARPLRLPKLEAVLPILSRNCST